MDNTRQSTMSSFKSCNTKVDPRWPPYSTELIPKCYSSPFHTQTSPLTTKPHAVKPPRNTKSPWKDHPTSLNPTTASNPIQSRTYCVSLFPQSIITKQGFKDYFEDSWSPLDRQQTGDSQGRCRCLWYRKALAGLPHPRSRSWGSRCIYMWYGGSHHWG